MHHRRIKEMRDGRRKGWIWNSSIFVELFDFFYFFWYRFVFMVWVGIKFFILLFLVIILSSGAK